MAFPLKSPALKKNMGRQRIFAQVVARADINLRIPAEKAARRVAVMQPRMRNEWLKSGALPAPNENRPIVLETPCAYFFPMPNTLPSA